MKAGVQQDNGFRVISLVICIEIRAPRTVGPVKINFWLFRAIPKREVGSKIDNLV